MFPVGELLEGSDAQITLLLERWRGGNQDALSSLMPMLYARLHSLASGMMQNERASHTLSPTAVIHEAYLRLHDTNVPWQDRAHFIAVAAREMRRVLVDHARTRSRAKRGGEWQRVSITGLDGLNGNSSNPLDILAIEAALEKLQAIDARKTQVVDLLLFGGLTIEETAHALNLSVPTINRDWKFARAFLQHELKSGDHR